ncbi:L1 capsid protein [Bos taurus papillomavirus 19]|uniref:Major capsid protein L1 n=1 Tax=Bos taurus papillomavirus 19 TaxID=1887217 RepID=A0A1B2K289_9PAPI|nr:L1 capsid protein [Bos taurus papillomavirus 19]ANZ90255.1 L1 capsid protein [Bos taurus papillomavirus 19]
MSLWVQDAGKLYLPPTKPVARVLSTDEYVIGTNMFYHANSQRLLTVGHPYYQILNADKSIKVPKVTGNQFRVFRLELPDPNKFAIPDVYNPENERLVWKLRGLEIDRGGPLGIGSTGHPLLNKLGDTENNVKLFKGEGDDNRQNISLDPKQTQLFVVGCSPCSGEHWDKAIPCEDAEVQKGDCPPLELKSTWIEDGDMCDIGFGHLNFQALQEDKAGVPLDIVNTTCKFIDLIKMSNETYGDSMFFYGKREQMYARHFWTRDGKIGEEIPTNGEARNDFFISPTGGISKGPHNYFISPSGSMVTSDANIFNRPFWLQRAQGHNNGIAWRNQLFITVVDNTRNTNYTITVKNGEDEGLGQPTYKASDFKQYLRHTEEYDLSMVFQLCKVPLQPDVLAHINAMNDSILEDWNLGFVPPTSVSIEDSYRYIKSAATKCPPKEPEKQADDPWKDLTFWKVDLKEKFSQDLAAFPLGRKFLYQTGLGTSGVERPLKRRKLTSSATSSKKKRKTK